jgi:hypothetical protein
MPTIYEARVEQTLLRRVKCDNCCQPYGYMMRVQGTGLAYRRFGLLSLFTSGGRNDAKDRAEADLAERLKLKLPESSPYPCPQCGFYQEARVQQLKKASNGFHFAGTLLAMLSLLPLEFPFPFRWVAIAALAAAGAALFAYGYKVASRYDPNGGDPEPRKAIGQKSTVWGKRLAELSAQPAMRH